MTPFPLTLEALEYRQRKQVLLGPVDLQLEGSRPIVILGPTGAGKSLLLTLLHGLIAPSTGELRWSRPEPALREAQSFVFQRPVLLDRTVARNLAFPLRKRGMKKRAALSEAELWAARVGVDAHLLRPALSLSLGEQQKVQVARALITKPKVVFLDDPCAPLDASATMVIEEVLRAAQAAGVAVILATRDPGQVQRLGADVVFMSGGQVLELTPGQQFLTQPATSEAAAFLEAADAG